jgi:hypothetical protein
MNTDQLLGPQRGGERMRLAEHDDGSRGGAHSRRARALGTIGSVPPDFRHELLRWR